MGISKNVNLNCLYVCILMFLIVGCKNNDEDTPLIGTPKYQNEVSCKYVLFPEDCFSNKIFKSFFNHIWQLEYIAIYRGSAFSTADLPRYSIAVDIEDFIGYELEFNSDFVRVGDRRIYYPNY